MAHGLITPWMLPVLLGYIFWPLVLAVGAGAAIAAACTRGGWRVAALLLTAACGIELAAVAAFWIDDLRTNAENARYEASLTSDLDAPTTVNGFDLPAGTHVTWSNPEHTDLEGARAPVPIRAFGVETDQVARKSEGWSLHLTAPHTLEGWTCGSNLEVGTEGQLQGCTLSAGRDWNGWPIPSGTSVYLAREDGTFSLELPDTPPIPAPEIGRPLPATRPITLNPDGSLASAYFELDSPLLVDDLSLWNTVTWHYAPDTFGQGRHRPIVSVTGYVPEDSTRDGRSIPSGAAVTFHFGSGQVTFE